MSKFLNKAVETYIIDTEEEVMAFQEEVRMANDYIVNKFSWKHKETKKEDYYIVAVEKTYNELDDGGEY